jgi:hypothetical protein
MGFGLCQAQVNLEIGQQEGEKKPQKSKMSSLKSKPSLGKRSENHQVLIPKSTLTSRGGDERIPGSRHHVAIAGSTHSCVRR